MKKIASLFICFLFIKALIAQNNLSQTNTNIIWFDDLQIQTFSEGIRPVSAKSNYSHDSMRIKGVHYKRGIGAQSPCVLVLLYIKTPNIFQH